MECGGAVGRGGRGVFWMSLFWITSVDRGARRRDSEGLGLR